MNHSTLVTSVVAAIIGVVAVAMSVVGDGVSGTIKNDGGASVSSRGTTAAVAADLPGASDTIHSEAMPALVTGDSRLDNYRLERDSCCIGND